MGRFRNQENRKQKFSYIFKNSLSWETLKYFMGHDTKKALQHKIRGKIAKEE
jgi:hypothetical protein